MSQIELMITRSEFCSIMEKIKAARSLVLKDCLVHLTEIKQFRNGHVEPDCNAVQGAQGRVLGIALCDIVQRGLPQSRQRSKSV